MRPGKSLAAVLASCLVGVAAPAHEAPRESAPAATTLEAQTARPQRGQSQRRGQSQQREQRREGPTRRSHTVVQSDGNPRLRPATQSPIAENEVEVRFDGGWRLLDANGIPDHATGPFPNQGNPNVIREQSYELRVASRPKLGRIRAIERGQLFGLTVTGIPFDPEAAEFYLGDPGGGWQYEALSGAIDLGLDESYAHVQPTGAYHYHGLPTLLLETQGVEADQHSPLIGWAADGFPIYALYGFATPDDRESEIVELESSFRLKRGDRPTGPDQPGGYYDGTFVADYEYVEGSGQLDECNGRFAATPEFPDGTYAYYLSRAWPVIPRCFRGEPSRDFGPARRR